MSGDRRILDVSAPSRPGGRPSPLLERTAPSQRGGRAASVSAAEGGSGGRAVDLEATAPSNAALRRSQVAAEDFREGDTLHAPVAPASPRSADAPEDRTVVAGSEAQMPVLLPRRVGRFAILRALGSGGMGSVYAAFDEELARRVAIKVLHVGEEMPLAARELLLAEAQAMARLSHPNVVQVYELGEHDGQIFLVMEFIAGTTLSEWLRELRPWTEVLTMLLAAGEGLAAAHRAGLVHLDYKPDNVLVTEEGIPKVADFGLSRLGSEGGGVIAGTPAYMSPEQHLGEATDARADIFAFCVVAYRALYDRVPFEGETLGDLRDAVIAGEVRPPEGRVQAPARVWSALQRGMSRKPGDRQADMDALLGELRAALPVKGRWPVSLAWIGALGLAGLALAVLLRPPAGPTPAEVAALFAEAHAAQLAADQAQWVYPAEAGGAGATAIRRINALERVEGPAGELARREADVLRRGYADELVVLGDHYWEDLRTRGFARDFYAQALIFRPDHEVALSRGNLTVGQLAQLRDQAEASGFSEAQLGAAATLRILADVERVDLEATLAALGDACEGAAVADAARGSEGVDGEAGAAGAEVEGVGDEGGDAAATSGDAAPSGGAEVEAGEGAGESAAPKGDGPAASAPTPAAAPTLPTVNPRALLADGEAARERGDDDEAYRLFSQVLVVSPRNASALAALSDIAFDRGAFREAARLAERAASAAPRAGEHQIRLGDAYFKLRRIKDARAAFERALELGESRASRRLELMDKGEGP